MKTFAADLHIHTLLSPCGDLDMSPLNIVKAARAKHLDIIAITDHNTTKHCRLIHELAANDDILVIGGAEVTSKEEAHCVGLFPDFNSLEQFEVYLQEHLPEIPNDPAKFGYQVQVDKAENIVYEEPKLLISAIDQSVEEIGKKVHSLGGLFIPAHVDRPVFGLISQLGFIPDDLNYDAIELSKHTTLRDFMDQHPFLDGKNFIRSSDAHFLRDIGSATTKFLLNEASFAEIKKALRKEGGRNIVVE